MYLALFVSIVLTPGGAEMSAGRARKTIFGNLAGVRNFLFTAALVVWAFAGLDGALSRDFGSSVFQLAAKIGGALLVCALLVELVRRYFENYSLDKMFEAKKVTRGELEDARVFSEKFLPEVPSLNQLRNIFEASRGCVWFINKCNFGLGFKKTERVGFFSLIRITSAAIPLFEKNNVNSFQMDRTHISGPKQSAPGLYIGGVGASGMRARGWAIQYLRSRIDSFLEVGGKVVFTRPVTDDGLRLASSLGFRPVVAEQSGLGNIYKLES